MGTIFHLDIVSAEESIYSGPAEFIVAPAVMGEVGIYPQHTPMLTRIKSGVVRVKAPLQDDEEIYVSGGMLEVQPDVVTILADTAVRGQDLDEAKALEAKRKAEEIMKNKTSDIEYARAQAELIEATAQLAAIRKLRKRRH
ncbi:MULTISPECIES: F0F1 ATP synthase subunit epsilon [Nitrosomonas]|uniref:ATP synthase epsilon chain n=2 Tax=Nitrosomonas eutropha TaxID=916 RepID=ATPE_NITEC|nr:MULTISPECIES: F0F1 ATP synthase subunit epsilon [Nitrosomonas]Q0AJA9.1 RecName: Full=ATP synthase epsilon chain; AltName: Full=ATP synthase F1 sector epsilon subunit; AltName: Full=F-ATPase epsilon subunit [Nitrosomonas eutropha C91]ABI58562.1 ATP synthase F1 subcomplex epsilon subunit [Nitrosomonas eutropha C91]MXS80946.1 F0F1 ATP synthase subunit epsilon [Nitrosomonas sp. GH22]PXV82357.1 ATP synthase F1 subcomplex epsilon subunit [Nitrosomonas eutropha]SCX13173.1 ATP synthase F1 subcomple